MSLSTIPDEILCLIFDRIPLQNQFTLCQISHRLNSVQKLASSRCRKLTLCISPPEHNAADLLTNSKFADPFDNSHKNHHSWIEFNELTNQKAKFLVENFPKMINLEVLYEGATAKTLEHLSFMLKCWKSTLITFKLIFNYKFHSYNFTTPKYINLTSLFDAINQLTELKNLTFDTRLPIMDRNIPVRARIFPLNLTQLESLSFKSYDHGPSVCEWFWSFVRSHPNLVKIQLGNLLNSQKPGGNHQAIYTLEAEFAAKFNFFYIDLDAGYKDFEIEFDLDRFCRLFAGLTHITMDTELYNFMNNQLYALSQLEHLNSLKLFMSQKDETRVLPRRQQIRVQLVSVRKINLNVHFPNHRALEWMCLDWIFPQIESLYIGRRAEGCCGRKEEANCARLFLQPLKTQFSGSKIKTFLFCDKITTEVNIDDL